MGPYLGERIVNAHQISLLASGAILLGYLVAALFFCRFWSVTRERLFGCFAVSFLLLAVERVLIVALQDMNHLPQIYLTRLIAFLVIAYAIWDKNRRSG